MMSPAWVAVEDRRSFGVVKNFLSKEDLSHVDNQGLELNLGETVRILGECRDWVYVRKIEDYEEGIVPKAFIHVFDCNVVRQCTEMELVIPKLASLVQELDPVLREWHKEAKRLYIHMNEDGFEGIRKKLLEIHDCRKNILSPNLPAEDLRDLKKQVGHLIDTGNHLLKFDMCVRDDKGHLLNPSVTSTIEFYRQHKKTAQILKRQENSSFRRSKLNSHHSCHSLLVVLESIKWKIVDKCEVRLFLYDFKEEKAFTESGIISMEYGLAPPTNMKFLFTDLGKFDLERKKVYLIIHVIRLGQMEYKENESKKEIPFSQRNSQIVRRPWGVSAKDITHFFSDTHNSNLRTRDEVILLPYIAFADHESLDALLAKLIKEQSLKDAKIINYGFTCSISLLSGNPIQIQEDLPHLFFTNPITVRKMGFPEVILPNDVRNELYIKLMRGELHRGSKASDRNIEVSVSVHDESGQRVKGVLFGGSGLPGQDVHQSIVYYHDDRPKWNEILKIQLPMSIEEFSVAHIKFTFKHRSSNESKDKAEKPFALSFLRLREVDGTAIDDGVHELFVYKVDSKLYKETDNKYLTYLSSIRSPLENGFKQQCQGYTISLKDIFFISTTLCSTKFTQNDKLQKLLQWSTKIKEIAERHSYLKMSRDNDKLGEILLETLKNVLNNVTNVSGEEIVKFLPDIFDALFTILVNPIESIQNELRSIQSGIDLLFDEELLTEACHRPVFDCLIYIFQLILDHKYQNFQSVLVVYIENGYSAALAHIKLLKELQHALENPDPPDKILKIMKSIEYFFKFIIYSYNNCIKLRELGGTGENGEFQEEFNRAVQRLFGAMCKLVSKRDKVYLTAQGGCLKHIPSIIDSLSTVVKPRNLSEWLGELVNVVPSGQLINQKLTTIADIVHSSLFLDPMCRANLLTIVTQNIKTHLPGNEEDFRGFRGIRNSIESAKRIGKIVKLLGPEAGETSSYKNFQDHSEETEKCVELLSDVMDILFRKDIGSTTWEISYLMQILMTPLIMSIGTIGENDSLASKMVAILLSILRQMNDDHYVTLINDLKKQDPGKFELQRFLSNILVIMKNFFSKPYFPCDWTEMILLQNSILLSGLEHFAKTIKGEFASPFVEQPWSNFLVSAVSFLTQDSLQVEQFTPYKSFTISSRYGDMRTRAAELIRIMWFSLGESKRIRFVPSMVGTFLDMALVSEPQIRRSTISIFFDMMHCEHENSKSFKQVEDELIKRLVELVEGGKGDREFRDIFYERMFEMCEHDNSGLQNPGILMVNTISRLLDLLLEYREVLFEDDNSNQMSCIVNLLEFSKEINKKELYLRYLYKLHDLHTEKNNYTEAAFTLQLHSKQLEWTLDEIPRHLKSNRHSNLSTQMDLKEALYFNIIEYFMKGKMWECALTVCEELRSIYTEETFSYDELPFLHRRMADLYQEINSPKEIRWEPEYFRVGFYGRGFPSFLQNQVFIYRGKPFEKLADFSDRMLERFPSATRLTKLNPPCEKKRNSHKQYLQMNAVSPQMSVSERMSRILLAEESVKKYYRYNEIENFTYSRPHIREPRDPENECASLWLERYYLLTSHSFPGILSWFVVIKESVVHVRPIENAIEEMEKSNMSLRELAVLHRVNPNEPLGILSLKLKGTLEAEVNGGVTKFEKAFLTNQYLQNNPDDVELIENLKKLIVEQAPIIAIVLNIHKEKCGAEFAGMQNKFEESYANLVKHIEEEYSINRMDLKDELLETALQKAFKKSQAALAKKGIISTTVGYAQNGASQTGRLSDNGSTLAGVTTRIGSTMVRSMGSFSSNISIYSQSKGNFGKSASKSQQGIFRRSTNFTGNNENDQQNYIGNSNQSFLSNSATLPRNSSNSSFGFVSNNKMGKLSSFDVTSTHSTHSVESTEGPPSSILSNSSSQMSENFISLTQSLTPQRPLRSQAEFTRKSSQNNCWNQPEIGLQQIPVPNLYDRLSGGENSNQGSFFGHSPDSGLFEEDIIPPALPPKNKDRNSGGDKPRPSTPPVPPKKPPLRQV